MDFSEKINEVSEEIELVEDRIEDVKIDLNRSRENYHEAARRGDQEGIKKHGQSWDQAESKLENLRQRKSNLKDKRVDIMSDYISRLKNRLTKEQVEELKEELFK